MTYEERIGGYSLDELLSVEKRIDQNQFPERHELVLKEIEKRKTYGDPEAVTTERVFPTSSSIPWSEVEKANFVNSVYKWSLVGIITGFFLVNVYTLIVTLYFLTLIPIALQGTILFLVFKEHKWARFLIKIWAVMLMVSGIAYWLKILALPSGLILETSIQKTMLLVIGLIFLGFANRCIHLQRKKASNQAITKDNQSIDIQNEPR